MAQKYDKIPPLVCRLLNNIKKNLIFVAFSEYTTFKDRFCDVFMFENKKLLGYLSKGGSFVNYVSFRGTYRV